MVRRNGNEGKKEGGKRRSKEEGGGREEEGEEKRKGGKFEVKKMELAPDETCKGRVHVNH